MKTIFISANDTGVGKTHVLATLLRLLKCDDKSIQLVKPIECGKPDLCEGDLAVAKKIAGKQNVRAETILSLPEPLAPLAAIQNCQWTMNSLVDKVKELPDAEWRLIEGAGGIAVPVDSNNFDWADFAEALNVDYALIVLEDRLGAVNQSRLIENYLKRYSFKSCFWLNECSRQQDAVHQSNLEAIHQLEIPVAAVQRYDQWDLEYEKFPWKK